MTTEEIRELIKLVADSGVAELEVQRGGNRVRIRAFGKESQLPPPATEQAAQTVEAPPAASAAKAAQPSAPEKSDVRLVTSPIVGTFYESSSPGSPPFVRVGATVQPGKVLCIIESMKLMNEIEAEFSGVIESKLVPNGQPVEYGEALFAIRPL